MKTQWGLIFALIFALIIAIFSVINVNHVTVNYLFGHSEWPLILVILGSVLMGGLIVGSIGIVRVFQLMHTKRRLTKQLKESQDEGEALTAKVEELTTKVEELTENADDTNKLVGEDVSVLELEDKEKPLHED